MSGAAPNAASALQNLRVLCMTACKLEACPLELPALTALSHLNLSSNLIYDFPPSMKSLAGLSVLTLRRNRLHSMPQVMLQLTALTALDVSDNEEFQFTEAAVVTARMPRLATFSFPTPCAACVWTPATVRSPALARVPGLR